MTTATERTRSVINVRKFLVGLLVNEYTPSKIQEEAYRLLKHYPTEFDMSELESNHIFEAHYYGD